MPVKNEWICNNCYLQQYREANRAYLSAVELGRYYRKRLVELEKKDKKVLKSIQAKLARRRKKVTVSQ